MQRTYTCIDRLNTGLLRIFHMSIRDGSFGPFLLLPLLLLMQARRKEECRGCLKERNSCLLGPGFLKDLGETTRMCYQYVMNDYDGLVN